MNNKRTIFARIITLVISLFIGLTVTGVSYAYFSNQVLGSNKQANGTVNTGIWKAPQSSVSGIRYSFNGNSVATLGWNATKNSYINGGSVALVYGETYTNLSGNIFGYKTVSETNVSLVIANTISGNANRNVTLKMTGLRKNGNLVTNATQTLSTYLSGTKQTLTFKLNVPTTEEIYGLRLQYLSDDYNYNWYYVSLFSISVSYKYSAVSSTNGSTSPSLAFSNYVIKMPDKWNTNDIQVGDMIAFHNTLDGVFLTEFETSSNATISAARTKYNEIRQLFASTYPL